MGSIWDPAPKNADNGAKVVARRVLLVPPWCGKGPQKHHISAKIVTRSPKSRSRKPPKKIQKKQ